MRTLPQGVLRGLGDALLRRDPSGILRAGAIGAGLAITAAGYLMGGVSQRIAGLFSAGMFARKHGKAPTEIVAADEPITSAH